MSPLTLTSCTHDQRQQYPGLPSTQTRLGGSIPHATHVLDTHCGALYRCVSAIIVAVVSEYDKNRGLYARAEPL